MGPITAATVQTPPHARAAMRHPAPAPRPVAPAISGSMPTRGLSRAARKLPVMMPNATRPKQSP